MEVGTTQSKTAVNAKAQPGMSPEKSATSVATPGQTGAWEDLGGPPDNYRPDDDSATLKTPGATLKQVKNVVNAKAQAGEQSPFKSATSVATPGQGVKEAKEADDDDDDDDEEEESGGRKSKLHKKMEEAVKMKGRKSSDDDDDEEDDDEEDDDEEEDDAGKGKKRAMKEAHKASKDEEDDDDDEEDDDEEEDESGKKMKKEEYNVDEDVNALLSGENLSENFKEKAKVIFEAALHSKVQEIRESLEEHYADALVEEVQEIKLELTERVDTYLEYVAAEWLEENALAVEKGLKTEITESFLTGMKGLFEEHYVSMPEEKYDVLESMVEKLDDMETKLNEQIQKNIALNKKLSESVSETVLNQVSEGLAVSQKDKLASLAESVEFESEDDYYQKLVTLRESYFPRNAGIPANETENLTEEANYSEVSPSMSAYLRALSTVAKK